MFGEMFGIIEVLIGVYVLVSAITGRGKLFINENIKKDKEAEYVRWLRRLSMVLGPVMLAAGIIDLVNMGRENAALNAAFSALFILSGLLVCGMFIVSVKFTDKQKAQQDKGKKGYKPAPKSAFEFDDEDK